MVTTSTGTTRISQTSTESLDPFIPPDFIHCFFIPTFPHLHRVASVVTSERLGYRLIRLEGKKRVRNLSTRQFYATFLPLNDQQTSIISEHNYHSILSSTELPTLYRSQRHHLNVSHLCNIWIVYHVIIE